jgi:hypothetical protein
LAIVARDRRTSRATSPTRLRSSAASAVSIATGAAAHGDADRGRRQGRGVVDAVAHLADRAGRRAQFAHDAHLSSGISWPDGDAETLPDGGRGPGVVASQHHARHPAPPAGRDVPGVRPRLVADRDQAERARRAVQDGDGGARLLQLADLTRGVPGQGVGRRARIGDRQAGAPDEAGQAAAGGGRDIRRQRRRQALGRGLLQDGAGDRVARPRLQCRRQAQHRRRVHREPDDPGHHRPPERQGAGLVERDGAQTADGSRTAPLFISNPCRALAASPAAIAAGVDDERAGTGDEQQRQRDRPRRPRVACRGPAATSVATATTAGM